MTDRENGRCAAAACYFHMCARRRRLQRKGIKMSWKHRREEACKDKACEDKAYKDKALRYADRQGRVTEVSTGQDKLLRGLYGSKTGRLLLKLLVSPAVTKIGGVLLNTRLSALFIGPFVRKNGIDLDQYGGQPYHSYNDFFTRPIKPECRPMNEEEEILISPCDGKLSVYPIGQDSTFSIKNTQYTLTSLLRSQKLAKRYEGGYACVFRLTVDDYHRYCYMADGEKSDNRRIPGIFHTVNPAANDVYPIYKENTREYCLLKTKLFGILLVMEVGALMVGKICNYHGAGHVLRGQEKGHFAFGGSTVVVLAPKGKVVLDEVLLSNTEKGCETIVKMGERIGTAAVNR